MTALRIPCIPTLFHNPHAVLLTAWLAVPLAVGCTAATEPSSGASPLQADVPSHVPGDYDWDGLSDLMYQQDDTAFLRGDLSRDGTQVPNPPGPVTSTDWRLAAATDLDGDGRPDFVFQNKTSHVVVSWFMRDFVRKDILGVGLPGAFTVPSVSEDPTDMLVCSADFNGDHQADLVFQSSDSSRRTITVWIMDPANPAVRLQSHVISSAIPGFSVNNFRVAGCGDFSGEGLGDLVLRGPAGNVTIAYIESYQAFEQHRIVNPTRDWNWTLGAVGDLTGDGHFELVWQNTGTLAVEAWLMNYSDYIGTRLLTPPSSLPPHPWRLVGPK
jgi:hypothetical protein